MVTEDIKVTQAMVDILDIPVTAIQAIPFITAILVTMVTPATIGTWDTRAILDTEVWGIQDTMNMGHHGHHGHNEHGNMGHHYGGEQR